MSKILCWLKKTIFKTKDESSPHIGTPHSAYICKVWLVSNGYVVECDGEHYVFEGRVDAFCDALRQINELIGPGTGRYSKERVWVCNAPGDKHLEFENYEWPWGDDPYP